MWAFLCGRPDRKERNSSASGPEVCRYSLRHRPARHSWKLPRLPAVRFVNGFLLPWLRKYPKSHVPALPACYRCRARLQGHPAVFSDRLARLRRWIEWGRFRIFLDIGNMVLRRSKAAIDGTCVLRQNGNDIVIPGQQFHYGKNLSISTKGTT